MLYEEKLTYLLKTQKFLNARVWDRRNNHLITGFEAATPDELKTKLLEFFNSWERTKFTVIFRPSTTVKWEDAFKHDFDTVEMIDNVPLNMQPNNISNGSYPTLYSADHSKDLIRVKEQAILEVRQEILGKDLKEKEEELTTAAGKLVFVIKHLLQYVPSPTTTTAVMQGQPPAQQQLPAQQQPPVQNQPPVQQVENQPPAQQEQSVDDKMRAEACNLLIKNIDPLTLLLFAQKIDTDETVLPLLKKWI